MTSVTLRDLDVAALAENPCNVRDELKGIDELAASIAVINVLQPLVVNDVDGTLVVTDGHRRLAAARRIHKKTVPALVTVGMCADGVLLTMLAAALHKELTPVEQARAFDKLRRRGMTAVEISRTTGWRAETVRSRLLLLELPAEALTMVEDEELTLTSAVELARASRDRHRFAQAPRRASQRSGWLTKTHPLAAIARTSCTHGSDRVLVGGVACGQCWEDAIRSHERHAPSIGQVAS